MAYFGHHSWKECPEDSSKKRQSDSRSIAQKTAQKAVTFNRWKRDGRNAASLIILPLPHFPIWSFPKIGVPPQLIHLVGIFHHKHQRKASRYWNPPQQADLASDLQVLKGGRASAEKAPLEFVRTLFFLRWKDALFWGLRIMTLYLLHMYIYIYVILHIITLYYTILYILYYIILYILYYIMLYYIILYHIILYSYYIILYYVMLSFIILYEYFII